LNGAHRLSAPQKLKDTHLLDGFDCGKDALNRWLRTHALANQKADYTQVMVVTHEDRVVGFYGLSMSSVHRDNLPKKIKAHPAPKDIPCLLLGQLAVDARWRGQGIGVGLLKDALTRAVSVADQAGMRAVVVNALDTEAAEFWAAVGFTAARGDPQTFFKSIDDIRLTLAASITG
jgi:predicted N-acetyltransferase YhbS